MHLSLGFVFGRQDSPAAIRGYKWVEWCPLISIGYRMFWVLCRILHSQNAENLDRIAKALRRCKGLEGLSALWFNPNDGSLLKVMRVTGAARLKSLDLTVTILGRSELADLLGTCVNLEDLQVCLKAF